MVRVGRKGLISVGGHLYVTGVIIQEVRIYWSKRPEKMSHFSDILVLFTN